MQLATKEAVEELIHNGNTISGILITSDTILRDAYDDLENLSIDAGGADIYLHPVKNSRQRASAAVMPF